MNPTMPGRRSLTHYASGCAAVFNNQVSAYRKGDRILASSVPQRLVGPCKAWWEGYTFLSNLQLEG